MSSGPVLLIIDLQQCLVAPSPEAGARSTPTLTTNVSRILARWRDLHYPLIHIHHRAADPADPLHDSHPESNQVHACAAPLQDEILRRKTTSSAFSSDRNGTSLVAALQELGASAAGAAARLVLIGMDGLQCINSTARAAADLGFHVTVVADACASFGVKRWSEPRQGWGPEETHDLAMSVLAAEYARVVTTDELLRGLE